MFMCCVYFFVFFFKQKTAYEMRISDWSSDVCSSDLDAAQHGAAFGKAAHLRDGLARQALAERPVVLVDAAVGGHAPIAPGPVGPLGDRGKLQPLLIPPFRGARGIAHRRVLLPAIGQIGRASWREGVGAYG